MNFSEKLKHTGTDTDTNTTCTESECQLQLPVRPRFEQIEPTIESQATIKNYKLLHTLGRGYLSK